MQVEKMAQSKVAAPMFHEPAPGRDGPYSASKRVVAQAQALRKIVTSPRIAQQKSTAMQLQRGRHGPPAQAAVSTAGGLPSQLKAGIEALSGISMDSVQVHYNSAEPAQLQAHAFAQGQHIHIAPGKEQYLPHEAWHVVQQAQGRVKPSRQLKGGPAINSDPALEHEADVMGARALQQRAAPVGLASKAWRATAASPAQCYTIENGFRVANDRKAAVKIGVNNKELYADAANIGAANATMARKQMPISLTQGPPWPDQVAPVLYEVTPEFEQGRSGLNFMDASLTPRDGIGHVELPSECEKGAIALIGAFTKTQRSPGNTQAYLDKEHEKARVAELLVQSAALAPQKALWYQAWVDLEEAVSWAITARSQRAYPRADIDQMLVRLTQVELGQEFNKYFDLNQAATAYASNYLYDEAGRERNLFDRIIRALDSQVAAVETQIMRTVDTGTGGEQAELVTASDLANQLRNFVALRDYDKTCIDQAIAAVPEAAQLQLALNNAFKVNQAGTKYIASNMFTRDATLLNIAKQVLAAIERKAADLTARNTKSLGNGSGINAEVNPVIGQSYGMLGGHYQLTDAGRWNWHWAAVILKAAQDNVTMEAHATHKQGAETHNERWDFRMYGSQAGSGQTFHDEWKDDGFGKAPITVLGVARDLPSKQALLPGFGINTLNDGQAVAAIAAARGIFFFCDTLENNALSQADLILAYQANIGAMAGHLGALPVAYVGAKIQVDWDVLMGSMADLIGNVGDAAAQLLRKGQAHQAAANLAVEVKTFYQLATHFQAHQRKRGVFV